MTIGGIEFLLFVAFVLFGYWVLPRRAAAQNAWLLGASYVFYASWDWRLLGLVIVGAAIDFQVTRRMAEEGAAESRKKRLLAVSLVWNLGALAFFKYEGFFADSLNALAQKVGLPELLPHLNLLLPLGISYYTLQRLSYVIDVYWGRQKPDTTALEFALFSCYFPQITAGPIARGRELLPQLALPRKASPGVMRTAGVELLLGFALSAWAAEYIGSLMVEPVYSAPGRLGATAHWMALVGYPLQVYADFAGYSLMAIGVSRLFGIVLPINFDAPFLSRSLPEFWRRWHITLNRWLFDYIFTPATTSRGRLRGRFNLAFMITFLGSGLWHGANWTFVLWGAMHGLGMVIHRVWDEYYRSLCRANRRWVAIRKGRIYATLSWALTISFFVLSLVLFRAASVGEAADFVGGLAGNGAGGLVLGLTGAFNLSLAIALIVFYQLSATRSGSAVLAGFVGLPQPLRACVYGLAIALLLLLTPVSSGTFIYQQF
jgi:alginate O-acetyltransferase complex protein AlgI